MYKEVQWNSDFPKMSSRICVCVKFWNKLKREGVLFRYQFTSRVGLGRIGPRMAQRTDGAENWCFLETSLHALRTGSNSGKDSLEEPGTGA